MCDLEDFLGTDGQLAVEEPIVHVIEAALSVRRLCRSGNQPRARMSAFVWKVTKYVDEPLTERFAKASEDLPQSSAIGTKKILIRHQDDGVVGRSTPDVVAIRIDSAQEAKLGAGCRILRHGTL